MNIVVEVPYIASEPESPFPAIDHQDCWDGFAVDGSFLAALPRWEDVLDVADTSWNWLNACLPDDISSKLTTMDKPTAAQFLKHIEELGRRGASQGLVGLSIDLGIDRLAWPDEGRSDEVVEQELNDCVPLVRDLVKRVQRSDVAVCLSLRLPLPSIAVNAQDLSVRLIKKVGNTQCRMQLNIMLEELKTSEPDELFGPYVKLLRSIRIRYEPQLGIRPTAEQHARWAEYLSKAGYEGNVIFAPRHEELHGFEYELGLLSREISANWHAAPSSAVIEDPPGADTSSLQID